MRLLSKKTFGVFFFQFTAKTGECFVVFSTVVVVVVVVVVIAAAMLSL